MKNLKYFALALLFGTVACATDHEEFDTNTERKAGSADVTITVVDENQQPISGVNISDTHYDINITTDENGQAVYHFDYAPFAVANLQFVHEDYKTVLTTMPIGSVKEGQNAEVAFTQPMLEKEYIYTATLSIYDKDDGLPVEGACVTVLNAGLGEIDPTYADAEGVATIYLPAPAVGESETYNVEITCLDFESTSATISIEYSADAKKGEAYETNCGAVVMKYTGEGKITGPHNVEMEATVEIPVSTGYDGGSYSFAESIIVRAFGLDDDSYAAALDNGEIIFEGVDADGDTHASNTNANGCWWGANQEVVGWGANARVFFEGGSYNTFTVGQYPGQVASGEVYPTCHRISYTDEEGKTWSVTFKVNVVIL